MKRSPIVRDRLVFLVVLAGALGAVGTVVGFGGGTSWLFDFAAHFRIQYVLLLSVSALLLLYFRRPGTAFTYAVFAGINILLLVPLYRAPTATAAASGPRFRVLQMNLLWTNNSEEAVVDFIRRTDADFIVLQEVTPRWMEAMEKVRAEYPYQVSCPQAGTFGIALLSARPLDQSEIAYIGQAQIPSVVARTTVDGRPLTILGAHAPSPLRPSRRGQREQLFDGIPACLEKFGGTQILVGDLNATPWCYPFRRLLLVTGLVNTMTGFGLQASWPAILLPLQIPIDHCLVTPDIRTVGRRLGAFVGSDHYPVVLDLAFSE